MKKRKNVVALAGRHSVPSTNDTDNGTEADSALAETTLELEQAIQRYVDLFDFAPIAYVGLDRVGRIEEANFAASRLLDRRRRALLGGPFMVHVVKEDADLFSNHLLKCRSGQALLETELRLKKRNGEIVFAYLSSTPTTSTMRNGALVYQTAIVDLTERKRAEAAIRQSEGRYRTLFNLVPIAVYTCDANGLILEFNRRAVELWGREPKTNDPTEKFCGSFKIYYPDGRLMLHRDCPMARALHGEKLTAGDMEITVERKDGARRNVVVNPTALRDERGKIVGAINCLYDITERKSWERQQHALYQFVERRHEANTLSELYDAALDTIIAASDCDHASIRLFDKADRLHFVRWRNLSAQYRKAIGSYSPWKRNAKNPQPISLGNIETGEITKSLRCTLKDEGIRACAFIPIIARGELIGKFMTGYNAPHFFSDQETSLALTIAGHLALGIQRLQAEEALRESQERFRLLVEGAKEYAIFLLDIDNCISFWSNGAERVFGWSAEEAVGQRGDLIFTPADRARGEVEKEIGTARAEGYASDRRWHLRKDGSRVWVDGVMRRLDDEQTGAIRGFAKIARDASDQRRNEEALRHARDELEQRVLERTAELMETNRELQGQIKVRRQLERELLEIVERERRRVGQDLHDIICQELTATALFLKSSANNTRNVAANKSLNEAAQIVNHNVTLARDLARGFQPVVLGPGGLPAALRSLSNEARARPSINCELKLARVIRIRDETVALNLYRVAQEAVRNAVMHSQGTDIVICIEREGKLVRLVVEDNGNGFRLPKRSKGLGMHIMRYRASVLGGTLAIESSPKGGTKVICEVPLKK